MDVAPKAICRMVVIKIGKFVYLCICVCHTWEFQKMYGLYGPKHHKVEKLK